MIWAAAGAFVAIFALAVPFPIIIAAAALSGVVLSLRKEQPAEDHRGEDAAA